MYNIDNIVKCTKYVIFEADGYTVEVTQLPNRNLSNVSMFAAGQEAVSASALVTIKYGNTIVLKQVVTANGAYSSTSKRYELTTFTHDADPQYLASGYTKTMTYWCASNKLTAELYLKIYKGGVHQVTGAAYVSIASNGTITITQ